MLFGRAGGGGAVGDVARLDGKTHCGRLGRVVWPGWKGRVECGYAPGLGPGRARD